MFTTLKNAFKIKEIRMKLLFTFLMLIVIRFGSQLPVPGVDRNYFSSWFEAQTGGAFNFFDAFTGGSFLNMSVFALNITPYITSSIIIQLLTIAIPKLEEMQRDGEDGRKKIVSITLYLISVHSHRLIIIYRILIDHDTGKYHYKQDTSQHHDNFPDFTILHIIVLQTPHLPYGHLIFNYIDIQSQLFKSF